MTEDLLTVQQSSVPNSQSYTIASYTTILQTASQYVEAVDVIPFSSDTRKHIKLLAVFTTLAQIASEFRRVVKTASPATRRNFSVVQKFKKANLAICRPLSHDRIRSPRSEQFLITRPIHPINMSSKVMQLFSNLVLFRAPRQASMFAAGGLQCTNNAGSVEGAWLRSESTMSGGA